MSAVISTGVCVCCGTCAPTGYSCRTRSGTAALVGHSEWAGYESTPPRKYRTLSQGGGYTLTAYTAAGCATPTGATSSCNWFGACTYDAVTGAYTQGGTQNCGGPTVTNCGNLGSRFTPGSPDVITTATTLDAIVTGTCFFGSSGWSRFTVANQYAHLSDEDTEADAITRLMAGAAGTWGAWTVVGDGSGSTCVNTTCCKAYWEERGAGDFDFAYGEAQWQVSRTGLTPSASFLIRVKSYRRLYGTLNPWVLFSTQVYGASSDGAGALTASGDTPNARGYETYSAEPELCTLP